MLTSDTVKYLVVHCSDTADDAGLGAEDIHAMHLGFGWEGIGYHKVITRAGIVQNGRPEFWVGAHVFGHNHESLGVCLIGRHEFTDAQMQRLEEVLRDWRERYPLARICGHCDFDTTQKTCPNFDVATWARGRKIIS